MRHRKLEKNRQVGPLASLILGAHLLIPLTAWLGFLLLGTFEADWKWKILAIILSPTVGGLLLLKQGLQDVCRGRFIGEVELFVFGSPIFGEVLPVMCMIPAKRALRTNELSAFLYWDEVAGYGASGDVKSNRTLVTEYRAGEVKLYPGDVLRHNMALPLSATPTSDTLPDTLGKLGRTFYKGTLTLKFCLAIDRCPDISEEYEIAVLEEYRKERA